MAANTSQVIVTAFGSITTASYTALGPTPIDCRMLELTDTTSKIVKIATGAAGSEVDICTCAVSGTVKVPYYLPKGTLLSIKAVDANASAGNNVVSLIP